MTASYCDKLLAWRAWHEANPTVWLYFERFALQAVSRGRTRIGHWLLINRVRWETAVVTAGDDFKIQNGYIAFYARLWRDTHPEHAGLFTIRPMDGEPWPYAGLNLDLL